MNKQWRGMFSSDVLKDNLMGVVVDEVHLAYKWYVLFAKYSYDKRLCIIELNYKP